MAQLIWCMLVDPSGARRSPCFCIENPCVKYVADLPSTVPLAVQEQLVSPMTAFWPKVYASEAALAAHEQPLEGTHRITELQGTPEACLAIVVPYRCIKRRIVWFDLVDKFGMSLLESVQCIAVDPMVDIRRFREAALVEVKAALHEHARSFNVAVFASRNSLESNQGPLPLDFPLLDTLGDGRDPADHLVLVADNVALKPPTTIQDVNYNLVAENGMPLLDSPQLVSLPSDPSFLVVRTAVFKHIRHHLKVEAVEANLTLYENNEAFLRNDSLPLHKRLSRACTAVLVVVQPIALKPSEVYVDIFEDTGVMMLASPLRVLLSEGSTICDVRDAAFEHICERLVKGTIEADLVVFEDQDAYTAKQPTPVEHNLKLTCSKVFVVVSKPTFVPAREVFYDFVDEGFNPVIRSTQFITLAGLTSVVSLQNLLLKVPEISKMVVNGVKPSDLKLFESYVTLHSPLKNDSPLERRHGARSTYPMVVMIPLSNLIKKYGRTI